MNTELIIVNASELKRHIGEPVLVKGIYSDQNFRWGIITEGGIQHADGMLEDDFYEECTFLLIADYGMHMDYWVKI